MEASWELHSPVAWSLGKKAGAHWTGGWVGPRTGPEVSEWTKISRPLPGYEIGNVLHVAQSHKFYTKNSDMSHISGQIFSNRHGVTSKNTWISRQKCLFGHWFRYSALNWRWIFNSRSHAIFWHSVIRREQQNARVSLCSPGRHKRGGGTAPLIPNLHTWTRVMGLSPYRFTLGECGLFPQNRSGCFAKENFLTLPGIEPLFLSCHGHSPSHYINWAINRSNKKLIFKHLFSNLTLAYNWLTDFVICSGYK